MGQPSTNEQHAGSSAAVWAVWRVCEAPLGQPVHAVISFSFRAYSICWTSTPSAVVPGLLVSTYNSIHCQYRQLCMPCWYGKRWRPSSCMPCVLHCNCSDSSQAHVQAVDWLQLRAVTQSECVKLPHISLCMFGCKQAGPICTTCML